ncbi:MAG: radical SAM protein [Candidatus Omnitrophota bacterium]
MKDDIKVIEKRSWIRYAGAVLKAKFLSIKTPLFISWILTNRCNFSCQYCHSHGNKAEELTTQQALDFVEKLARCGTQGVTLTGGEPLMREDLGKIVDSCVAQDIAVVLNSNGFMVAERIADIRKVKMVMLSLDGPEEIHDSIRGKGSFSMVMRAIDCVRARGIKVCIGTTLSSLNLSSLDSIFRISKKNKLQVFFQPAEKYQLRYNELNSIVPLAEAYKRAIAAIMVEKKNNCFIGNSFSGLKSLSCWPEPHLPLKCYGGILFVRIDANGDIKVCGRRHGSLVLGNILKNDFSNIFKGAAPAVCSTCWCASRVEFNKAMAFDLEALLGILKKV